MDQQTQNTVTDTVGNVASKVQFTGAGTAIFCGLSVNDWGVIFGILIGVAGLLVNLFFKWRDDQRKQKLADHFATHRHDDIPEALKAFSEQDS